MDVLVILVRFGAIDGSINIAGYPRVFLPFQGPTRGSLCNTAEFSWADISAR